MKHSIVLRANQPLSVTVTLYDHRNSQEKSFENGKNGNDMPRECLHALWLQLVADSRTEEESVIGVGEATAESSIRSRSSNCIIRELAESKHQLMRYTHLVTAIRLTLNHVNSKGNTTLRDIYYRDVAAFGGKQTNLNAALKLLSRSLNLSLTTDLLIHPSPKGLIWGGDFVLLTQNGNPVFELNYQKNYQMIPYIPEDVQFTASKAPSVIIVMEKEAVFKSFCDYVRELKTEMSLIVLTGKGFPDTCTKRFVWCLQRSFPSTPVLFFVDSDVYGIRIFWCFVDSESQFYVCRSEIAGVFLFEYQEGWISILAKERLLMIRSLQLNETRRWSDGSTSRRLQPTAIRPKIEEFLLDGSLPHPNSPFVNFQPEASQEASQAAASKQLHLQPYHLQARENINAKIIHRELTRGLLFGAKAEMNILGDSTKPAATLNHYLWCKIKLAGEVTCSKGGLRPADNRGIHPTLTN